MRRQQEELYFGPPVEWNRLLLLPIVEVTLAVVAGPERSAHVHADATMAGIVLTKGASARLIWARHRPYRDFRDTLCRHQREAGA